MSTEEHDYDDEISEEQELVIRALHNGVVKGQVVLEDEEDAVLLMFGLGSLVFVRDSYLLVHFISTGEIMKVLEFARDECRQVQEHQMSTGNWYSGRAEKLAKEKLIKLCSYDVKRAYEINDNPEDQGDDETLRDLPLEIRMSFAGIYDGNIRTGGV